MESRILQAMRSRAQHFRDSADDLTFEGVRRLLEKDMGLDTFALDPHKKFVKATLEKYLSGAEEDDKSKGAEPGNVKKKKQLLKKKKVEEVEVAKGEKDEEEVVAKGEKDEEVVAEEEKVEEEVAKEEKNEEEEEVAKEEKDEEEVAKEQKVEDDSETEIDAKDKMPTEEMITEAIWNKATYFRSNSENLTLVAVRRLLEEDLELEKFSLDSFKKLISKQLDEVLNSESNKDADSSPSYKQAKVKPKKKSEPKGNVQKSQEPKKRKKPAQESDRPRKKKSTRAEEANNNDEDQSENELSAGDTVKKEVVAPVYGKKVERLKSIIKACGMTVAPSVYRKAKQAPEDKREAILIKELQEVLSKEGLSTNPSEKEIKDVKRRKDRAKELEGIDTSNIVQGSRRRSTTWPPPKPPKEPVESDSDDSEGGGDDDDSEDGDGSEKGDGSDDQNEDEDVHAIQSGEENKDEDAHATQSGEEAPEETFDSE